jgi:hypothetical protein
MGCLLKQRQDILQGIANNPQADYKSRIAAHHLAGEISAVIMKLHIEAPAMLAQRHRFPITPSLTGLGTTGLKLVPKNKDELEEEGGDEIRARTC